MTVDNYISNMARMILKNHDIVSVHELSMMIRDRDSRKKYPKLEGKDIKELIYRNLEYIAVNEIYFSSNQFTRRNN